MSSSGCLKKVGLFVTLAFVWLLPNNSLRGTVIFSGEDDKTWWNRL